MRALPPNIRAGFQADAKPSLEERLAAFRERMDNPHGFEIFRRQDAKSSGEKIRDVQSDAAGVETGLPRKAKRESVKPGSNLTGRSVGVFIALLACVGLSVSGPGASAADTCRKVRGSSVYDCRPPAERKDQPGEDEHVYGGWTVATYRDPFSNQPPVHWLEAKLDDGAVLSADCTNRLSLWFEFEGVPKNRVVAVTILFRMDARPIISSKGLILFGRLQIDSAREFLRELREGERLFLRVHVGEPGSFEMDVRPGADGTVALQDFFTSCRLLDAGA